MRLIIIFTLATFSLVNAQYTGGKNDGSTRSSLNGSRLSGEIASFTVLYQGNSGDGFDSNSNQILLSDSNFRIFDGSYGDGFSKNNSILILNGNTLSDLYRGNFGDGHSQDTFQALFNGQDLSILFKGNIGDGSDFGKLSSVFLEGFILAIFQGGSGDGSASSLEFNNYLSGLMLMLYNGGKGDGYAANSLTTALTLDIIDYLVENEIILYPNPANRTVNLKLSKSIKILEIFLYDTSGKKLNVELTKENTFDVSNISDGIYLLTILSESGTEDIKRLIVKK